MVRRRGVAARVGLYLPGVGSPRYRGDMAAWDDAPTSEQLQAIQAKAEEKLRGGIEKPRSGDPNDVKKTLEANAQTGEKIASQSEEQASQVLTPEQKQRLEKLRGAPFTLDRSDAVGQ